MQEPWICPRCNTVNAGWNPQCFCSLQSGSGTISHWNTVQISKCQVCDQYHAINIYCRKEK